MKTIKNIGKDLKEGDSVTIIRNGKHSKEVARSYGKVLKIERIVKSRDCFLYKIRGVPNYALREDLQLAKERSR